MTDDSNKTDTPKPGGRARKRPHVAPKPKGVPEREQSTIAFPYMDLESGITVANAMLEAGGVALSRDQLAGTMKLVANSGNFVTKVATSRMFGLVANNAGKYELTNLGFSIVDSDDRRVRSAKAEAFLNVPLYKRAYEEFKGKQLPPRPHGLEQAFVRFGVSTKQKTNARLAFDKSAAQAGYFLNGNDRLIEPIIGGGTQRATRIEAAERGDEEGTEAAAPVTKSRAPDKPELPHFMHMLIDALPAIGTTWTVDGRAKWLQGAAAAFDLSYKGDGAIMIQAKAAPNADKKEE